MLGSWMSNRNRPSSYGVRVGPLMRAENKSCVGETKATLTQFLMCVTEVNVGQCDERINIENNKEVKLSWREAWRTLCHVLQWYVWLNTHHAIFKCFDHDAVRQRRRQQSHLFPHCAEELLCLRWLKLHFLEWVSVYKNREEGQNNGWRAAQKESKKKRKKKRYKCNFACVGREFIKLMDACVCDWGAWLQNENGRQLLSLIIMKKCTR